MNKKQGETLREKDTERPRKCVCVCCAPLADPWPAHWLNGDYHRAQSDLIGRLLWNRGPASQLSARTQTQSLSIMEPASNELGAQQEKCH